MKNKIIALAFIFALLMCGCSQIITEHYAKLDSLTAEAASELLDRVTIWPGGRLDISLNYLDDIPGVLAVEHDNTT